MSLPVHPSEPQPLHPSELSFETLCDFFEILKARQGKFKERREAVESFIRHCIYRPYGEAFDVFRLILPRLDTERGNYNLKEKALGERFAEALGWSKKDPKAKSLLNYKNPGIAVGAGDLSAIVQAVVSTQARVPDNASKEERTKVKIGDVNMKLDELVKAGNRKDEQAPILRYFTRNCTPRQLKWLTQIILKDMKHGTGETLIFKAWHSDAQDVYDNTMNFRKVFNELTDPNMPADSSVTPGHPVRPQLANAVNSAKAAFYKMHRSKAEGGDLRPFLIETKFDGERIQVGKKKNPFIAFLPFFHKKKSVAGMTKIL